MNYELGSQKNAGSRFGFTQHRFYFKSGVGFTLIEVVIVVSLVVILATFGLWLGMDAYRSYSYRSEENILVSALQRARLASMVNINESKHGVRIESDRYTIFQGGDWDHRVLGFDQVFVPAGTVTITPPSPPDVIFEQLSGKSSPATIVVTDGVRTRTILITNEGKISW